MILPPFLLPLGDILPTVSLPLGDILPTFSLRYPLRLLLNLGIGFYGYGSHVVLCGSLEQVNVAIRSSFGFVYIRWL